MSSHEGITFEDELAMYQDGIDPGDGVPEPIEDEEEEEEVARG